jgi:hypothetical protein
MSTASNTDLTEGMVRNIIMTWYHGTNEHSPVESLLMLLAGDVEMSYPNHPTPFIGLQAFRDWYGDVLQRYFDETHEIQSIDIALNGPRADATVVVRWEARSWTVGAARSEYRAHLSRQRFRIVRRDDGRAAITAKIVETFEPTAPLYGVGA